MKHITAIILAAGKGTRIKANSRNKVVYELASRPMIQYTVDNLKKAGIKDIVVVIGYAKDSVKKVLGSSVKYAIQKSQLGTGHAFKTGLTKVKPSTKYIISVYGDDSAFYKPIIIKELIKKHKQSQAVISFLTLIKQDPTGLGRIIRDSQGNIKAIVEEKNASPKQKQIKEINTGLYCFTRQYIKSAINKITKNPITKEFYLPDIVEIALKDKQTVKTLKYKEAILWYGVNTQAELETADKIMRLKLKHAADKS